MRTFKNRTLSTVMLIQIAIFATFVIQGCAVKTTEEIKRKENVAPGKKVQFAPLPNYSLTKKGASDQMDLTNGQISDRRDNKLWYESKSVGFWYAGLQQLSIDLGAVYPIKEVGIRFQGGAPQPATGFPVWIDLLVSDDGEHYYKVASYSRWRKGDPKKYGLPEVKGKSWVYPIKFENLSTKGRFVGLTFYCSGLTVCDEMWVLKGEQALKKTPLKENQLSDFTVEGPRLYFHRPVVRFSTNIATPNPVGLILTRKKAIRKMLVDLDFPPGLTLLGGSWGGKTIKNLRSKPVKIQGQIFHRYTLTSNQIQTAKNWGRIYFTGDWESGQKGFLRYRLRWGNKQSPFTKQPIEAVDIPLTRQPKKLTTGLGWWHMDATKRWPGVMKAFRQLGLNTVSLFGVILKNDEAGTLAWLKKFRQNGFRVMNVDSPFHYMIKTHPNLTEFFCQFEDGSHGTKFCPSYRGKYYREEIARLASQTAKMKANYLSLDIELWNWRGPKDPQVCRRCQADYQKSGQTSWNLWKLEKGYQIWTDISNAVRQEIRQYSAGRRNGLPVIEIGGYDFRPGENYQFFWPFDRLYPSSIQNSQPSIYSHLEPYHLEHIGDEVRADRKKLPKSAVLPWLTPGDAGIFPGEMFRYAILECFANGARGMQFWSDRLWDTETLLAYSRAIQIAVPVEGVIMEGKLLEGVESKPKIRISGMQHGDEIFLLAADYYRHLQGAATIKIPVRVKCSVVDLESGKQETQISPDKNSFRVDFGNKLARAFYIRPG